MALSSVLFVFSILCALTVWKRLSSKRKNIPPGLKPLPGPKGWPILGSVPEVPEKNGFVKFADWGKEYGPIYQVNLAGSNHVWISSDAIARDLLSKKGAIYSDRPHIPALISDNRTSAQYLTLLSKNAGWTRQRKFANHIMRESERATFHRYPELEAKRLLVELMEEPSKYNHALESFVARVTCRLAWGRSEASDELKQRARELLIGVSPTGALGNKIPFVMSLPDWFSPAKAWERRRAKTERRFFEIMQEEVEKDMGEKKAPQSWMRTYLDTKASNPFNFQYGLEGAYCVGMHGIAGALTIAAPMQAFCLAMCHYPQYLPMLQEELDRVCGDRPPVAEDRPNMPVLRAMIREIFRWRPAVPTGIPHYLTQDDSYNGYHIPAGSVMHPLEWAISRDPELFPDPEEFNPNRWLKPEYPTYQEPLSRYPSIINCTQFGYGRRLCQGQAVADEDLLIGIGSLAWLFDIRQTPATLENKVDDIYANEKATISSEELNTGLLDPNINSDSEDDVGSICSSSPGAFPPSSIEEEKEEAMIRVEKAAKNKIDPKLDFSTLLIAKPLPFKFELTVRDQRRAESIRAEYEKLKAEGEFTESRNYWGDNKGELGWGKV